MSDLLHIRPQTSELLRRLREPRRFIQVISGARQVGKSTMVNHAAKESSLPYRISSADDPMLRGSDWLDQQWQLGRFLVQEAGESGALLVLDEVQKLPQWSEAVKRLWDEDTLNGVNLKVVITGSAPLLMGLGLSESLAGRFELLPLPHWSYQEMHDAFGWSLNQFVFYGAYPGAAPLVRYPARWSSYIRDSLIETTIARDVLLLSRVDKPALMRRLFALGSSFSGQILSYSKMLGQLQDAGNTTTLAHYLDLLAGAGMMVGLQQYAGNQSRRARSSPKLQVFNTALMSATSGMTLTNARNTPDFWGRLVESAIGAHLVNASLAGECEVFYWRQRNREVDFVVRSGNEVTAIEVKSGRAREARVGLSTFSEAHRTTRKLLVGGDGISVEEFLSKPATYWVG